MAFDIKHFGVCLSIRTGALLAYKPILVVQGVEFCFNTSNLLPVIEQPQE